MASSTKTMIRQAILPCSAGVLIHLGLFIRGEWHLKAPAVVTLHAIGFCLVLAISHGLHQTSSVALARSLSDTASVTTAYLMGLLGSMAVYRMLFHPLRSFPGPRLAALSKLWHVWKCRDSRGHHVLENWHQKYGAIVRTGKNGVPQTYFALMLTRVKAQMSSPFFIPLRSSYWMARERATPDLTGMTCSSREYRRSSPVTRASTKDGGSSGIRLCRLLVSLYLLRMSILLVRLLMGSLDCSSEPIL